MRRTLFLDGRLVDERQYARVTGNWSLVSKTSISRNNRISCFRWGPDSKFSIVPKPKGPEKWQLYNLVKDPGEIHDLADQEPDRMEKMIKLWDQYVLETGVVPLAPELGNWIAATEAQMPENVWMEYEYWHEGARDDPKKYLRKPPRFQRVVKAI